jgi:hypothetical protein
MASYLYNSLKRIVVGEEDDDPSCLKDPVTMSLYEDPLKGLGLKQTAQPWDMRDALRTNCLNLVAQSSLNRRDKPLLPHKYALIAYHLAAKTINVKKAQDLKKLFDEEPHLFSGAVPRRAEVPSRRRRDSAPSEKAMGGLWSKFEPIHSCRDRVPRRATDGHAADSEAGPL